MEHLVVRWDVANRSGLSGEAAAAQEYVVKLPDRIRKLAERASARKAKTKVVHSPFSWIFDRKVEL
ncbi:Acyl-[acyl-carrier-protein] desaturase, chloroplastic [Tetrabaena socialis]|uniref:Acyl-[acyl-carrier-protein] desaturase, chloroplastic n=1 Tax=Tetrabaena socialis TaxID=47790 RepID=A0A2J8AHN7_9CHLO|nr:Acyl-[acyl-carrier-protein] desaturase, chloroplastic [Tetrabaena socialis]|eukprot:PNH12045.1 Acyl-[acyl-carrier-protein] desaturase, chloroplastic [Tetrabaena socialis]